MTSIPHHHDVPSEVNDVNELRPASGVEEMIAHELAKAAEDVRRLEADAVKRGAPLKLSGARYRIYNTDATD
ncbi:hypothetical protein M1D34_31865 (plasmid) [Ensifer sp. D2-11]